MATTGKSIRAAAAASALRSMWADPVKRQARIEKLRAAALKRPQPRPTESGFTHVRTQAPAAVLGEIAADPYEALLFGGVR